VLVGVAELLAELDVMVVLLLEVADGAEDVADVDEVIADLAEDVADVDEVIADTDEEIADTDEEIAETDEEGANVVDAERLVDEVITALVDEVLFEDEVLFADEVLLALVDKEVLFVLVDEEESALTTEVVDLSADVVGLLDEEDLVEDLMDDDTAFITTEAGLLEDRADVVAGWLVVVDLREEELETAFDRVVDIFLEVEVGSELLL